ncbi:MAG: hypothetical protein BWY74_00003 [Firmicutes bacterium ADurb.Bin419]|nr:MAG: hypothetical protein BWY74_00003 [Firmicutes bacterium ADurb.Bin419]
MNNMLKFKNKEHLEFFNNCLAYPGIPNDSYYKALFYTLGLTNETRKNINSLFDFERRTIDFNGFKKGWQTGTSKKVTRLAFNLFNGSVCDSDEDFENNKVSPYYAVDEIFCCGLAPYFYQAIKLRYPEYCSEETHPERALPLDPS